MGTTLTVNDRELALALSSTHLLFSEKWQAELAQRPEEIESSAGMNSMGNQTWVAPMVAHYLPTMLAFSYFFVTWLSSNIFYSFWCNVDLWFSALYWQEMILQTKANLKLLKWIAGVSLIVEGTKRKGKTVLKCYYHLNEINTDYFLQDCHRILQIFSKYGAWYCWHSIIISVIM